MKNHFEQVSRPSTTATAHRRIGIPRHETRAFVVTTGGTNGWSVSQIFRSHPLFGVFQSFPTIHGPNGFHGVYLKHVSHGVTYEGGSGLGELMAPVVLPQLFVIVKIIVGHIILSWRVLVRRAVEL